MSTVLLGVLPRFSCRWDGAGAGCCANGVVGCRAEIYGKRGRDEKEKGK